VPSPVCSANYRKPEPLQIQPWPGKFVQRFSVFLFSLSLSLSLSASAPGSSSQVLMLYVAGPPTGPILPLLSNHDREKFETFVYADVPGGDRYASKVRGHVPKQREIAGVITSLCDLPGG